MPLKTGEHNFSICINLIALFMLNKIAAKNTSYFTSFSDNWNDLVNVKQEHRKEEST